MSMLQLSDTGAETQVVITRVFNAPRELVFAAWSHPEQLARWHAPQGCSIEFTHFDFQVGGTFRSTLSTPEGKGCECLGTYREIEVPERIVYLLGFCDEEGNATDALPEGMDPAWPAETLVTVTFEDTDGKTRFTLCQTVELELAKRTGAYPSWLQMLDRLEEVMASEQIDR